MLAGLALLAGCTAAVDGAALRGPGALSGSPSDSSGGSTPGAAATLTGDSITIPPGGPASAGTTTAAPTTTTGAIQPSATATGSAGDASPVPSGLGKYYGQQLQWSGCGSFAPDTASVPAYSRPALQCARLTVPLSYAKPTGPTIQIAVMRKPATGTSRTGSLLINPGGPGDSGLTFLAGSAYASAYAPLNQSFDLVGFDPRGVGASVPAIQCYTGPEWDAFLATDPRSATAADVAEANKVTRQYVADCVARSGSGSITGRDFLPQVGTVDAVKDMDVLRAALKDRKLTYLGYSYGTRLGYVYAEQFPKNIRAMILDGVVSPTADAADSQVQQSQSFQNAFTAFAGWCAQNVQGCPLGTDTAAFSSRYQQLVRPLLTTPLPIADGRRLSFTLANTGLNYALYNDSAWPILARALGALAQGNGNPMMVLADSYYQRDATGHYANLIDAFNAIRCTDEVPITDPAQITALNQQVIKVAPAQWNGDPAGAIADTCAYWPFKATWTPHKLSIPDMPKVLVISTTGDPATPYADGVELSRQIPSVLISVSGTRHTAFLHGISCVDQAGETYLQTLQLPAANVSC